LTAEAERRRPGRPAGASDTRERILASARELFAQNGIDKTSIRAVAAVAGVDPALVHHYYGTKQQLFAAAIHVPIDPMEVLGPLRDTPVDKLGYMLPKVLLPLWDSELGAGLIATRADLLDGLDAAYCDYLERIWRELDRCYGDALWWTSLAEVAGRCRATQS